MYPQQHFLINLILSLFLLLVFPPTYVLIFFLASFLIDFDHYLYYIFEEKDFSLKRAYKWFAIKKEALKKMPEKERKIHKRWFLVFHGVEGLALVLLLSKLFYPFLFVFIGMLAHNIEDLFEEIPLGIAERKLSLIYALYLHFKHGKLKHYTKGH